MASKTLVALVVSSTLMLLGSVFMVVGLITTEWMDGNNKDVSLNLFEFCQNGDCDNMGDEDETKKKLPETSKSDLDTCRFLGVFGASFGFLAFLLSLMFNGMFYAGVEVNRKQLMKEMIIFILCLCGLSVIMTSASSAVFKKKVYDKEDPDDIIDYELGFSFYLNLIGGLLFLPAGILAAFSGARNGRS